MNSILKGARPVWLALGTALLLANVPFSRAFLGLSALLWLPGYLLAGDERVASAFRDAAKRQSAARQLAFVILLALLALLAIGPLGGLLAITAFTVPVLLAARRGDAALIEAAQGIAIATCMTALLLVGVEFILRRPRLANRVGTPAARAAWDVNYDSLWARNPFGFRSRHATIARNDERRIIAIGDSYTWGDKIGSTDSLWTNHLEAGLGDSGPTEVINMAQRGWTTANEEEYLATVGWQFAPDLVVVQFFANDALPSGPGLQREGERWVRVIPSRMRDTPVGQSALAYLLERAVNQWRVAADPAGGYSALYRDDAVGLAQFRDALRAIGDSARARGVPALLVLFPVFAPGQWNADSYPLREIHARVLREASAAGLDTLDLAPVFAAAQQDGRTWWALSWDSHPNAAAHRVAGDAVARAITQRGLLRAAGPDQPAAARPSARRP